MFLNCVIGSTVTIGRGTNCTISLRVPQMSSHHCTLIYIEDQNVIKVKDESTNGTWVNKVRLKKQTSLVCDGDEIIFVPASKKRKRSFVLFFFSLFFFICSCIVPCKSDSVKFTERIVFLCCLLLVYIFNCIAFF